MRLSKWMELALAATALAAPLAGAQELTGSDRAVDTFSEVEHGLYADAEVGYLLLSVPGVNGGLGTGSVVGVSLGYDVSANFGIGLFVLTAAVSTPNDYQAFSGGSTQGDLTAIMPGVEARLHLPLSRDSNGTQRLFFNIGAGIGLMFLQPRDLFPAGADGVGVKINVGLEYFTHVRHLSLGLALDGLASFPSGGTLVGAALSPFIKYSF